MRKVSFMIVSIFFFFASFAQAVMPARKNDDNLTYAFAQARKAQVKDVNYDLHFVLEKDSEEYSGHAVLNITLNRTSDPLSIDFKTKKIEQIKVNEKMVEDFKTRNGFVEIPAKYLAAATKVEVDYVGSFSKDGDGFQRVIDPEDQSVYIYTDSEPDKAHSFFPCFDQPDLKAKFNVKVEVPKDWLVIGNELVARSSKVDDSLVVELKTTPKISTYLFFLGAGNFEVWKDSYENIPLELYARKSFKKYIDHQNIFESTKKGLKFFSEYFGTRYPFSKYGQVFVPEFAWGGMENPGAVTLNERNIYRGTPKQSDLDNRNDLILHEMAHMWFGDLVTMNWWNDLWLNESFASYLAALAQDRAMQAKVTWLDFYSSKGWGYWQDQLSTTHPIETVVTDVRTSKGNFDGITYAKGAATLKQLHFFVGEDGFREGLRSYFKKFAWSNTSRADFIGEIAKASSKDLEGWTKSWLQTAGPHRVQIKWQCDDVAKKISLFEILQSPNVSKAYSPHRTQIAFFNKKEGEKFELNKTIEVSYEGKTTVVAEANGIACPDFVYPNYEDQDYALFSLDPVSLKNAEQVLKGGISNPLTRLMVWSTLSQMVRDTELRVSDYMNFALSGLEIESDPEILAILLGSHSNIANNYWRYLTKVQRSTIAPQLEKLIWQKVESAPNNNMRLIYFDFFVSIASTTDSVTRLNSMMKGESKVDGVDLDQDRRWDIAEALAKANAPKVAALVESERKKDPTTTGQRSALAAWVAIPTAAAKADFWKMLAKPKDIPYSNLRSASANFNHSDYPDLSTKYVQPFFNTVTSYNWNENDNLVEIFFERIFPQNICSAELLKKSQQFFNSAKNLTSLARRSWKEANDELSKCVAIRKADKAPLKTSP